MKSLLLLSGMFLSVAFGQQVVGQEQGSNQNFEKFKQSYPRIFESKNLVLEKARQRGIPATIELPNNIKAELQYFDETDSPIYYTIFNSTAAKTTGANALQPGGELNLNLSGQGMTVGIYDQTRPKADHVEFEDRLTQVDGSTETISNHATHVSGTILAAGVNTNARGMAYDATGWSFNWESDLSKMNGNAYDPETKPNGHILSNHSYGNIVGWYRNASNNWVWSGNPSIDEDEDYRFGFYSAKSKGLDDLMVDKPYYTIVWAAGNDRNDTGDGTRNPDGPDDSIGPEGVAKNVITVGAVSGVPEYTGPGDVQISNFSSWGPTDDGRIKPDIVGMGVSVFSSAIADGGESDSYASLSGTSMASPNVTGSLLLLQQLFNERNNGRYMRSSTLKGLMINTSKEAGNNPGPDYIHGWGLLDVKSAAEIILNENGTSQFIREELLEENQTYEYEFISDGVTPIRATVAWIDPSGTPPSPSLNPENLMLVNDLDMRIIDEQGNIYYPWTLNPENGPNGRAAQDQDNFRDNVEQIQIDNPTSQRYRLVINHKGDLTNSQQEFSLIFKAGIIDGADETLYWIGGESGDWNNPANWSFTLGGSSANRIPDGGTRVVFEGSSGQSEVSLSASSEVFSINFFGNQLVNLNLEGNTINILNGLRISNQITSIVNGTMLFENSTDNQQLVELGQSALDDVSLKFARGSWRVISADHMDRVWIENSQVQFDIPIIRATELVLQGNAELQGNFDLIELEGDFQAGQGTVLREGTNLNFIGNSGKFENNSSNQAINLAALSGSYTLNTGGISELTVSDATLLMDTESISLNRLRLGQAATVDLGNTGELAVAEEIESIAESSEPSVIRSNTKGTIVHDIYRKYCFENIGVVNVDFEGEAIVNLGSGAVIENSTGWLAQNCDDVLFANFRVSFTCEGAAVTFENLSEGLAEEFSWNFADLGSSSSEHPIFVFDSPGNYLVSLEVSNETGSTVYEQEIEILPNELAKPVIVANGTTLTSQQPGSSYQWYLNGELIESATSRSLNASEDGIYQVAIFNESCNRISDPVVISALPDQEAELGRLGIFVGPVPSEDFVTVSVNNDYQGPIQLVLMDMAGRIFRKIDASKNSDKLEIELILPSNQGIYLIQIITNNLTVHKKVIKQ
ncbi:S8 family serine peptidase [Algoriphagus hitonicola]|uniref:Por secretion system C-terminal sorting domain-containing protein n=1 Tax=Algoriphagus hitonicola TaxID=435880 RepID=A0A1I2NRT7_9BACT|nr:S8 family serine peptidase [Algoriphagus hitonicola]SFG05720.1 Por secretion system C-terminal sorting domain-containing protein [Algoriphagus hitonicola]